MFDSILLYMEIKFFLASVLIVFFCAGCSPGLLYTDIVRPECKDLRGTTLGERRAEGGTKKLEIPTGDVDITFSWDSRAIGDIAKQNGIKVVHGCDKREFSILAGIWKEESIIIYGR